MCIGLVACTSHPNRLSPSGGNEPFKSIYLVSHGWHAGIVIKRSDIPDGLWSEQDDFPGADYLEVGWGDKTYYMTPNPPLGATLAAGLLPTASVLHIVGFNGSVTDFFPHSEIIKIDLPFDGFVQLCGYIENSYAKDEARLSELLGPGLYGRSQFYLSRETYHVFNTCNVWTARALNAAGCPITPATTLTVGGLMDKAVSFGTVIQARQSVYGKRRSQPPSACG